MVAVEIASTRPVRDYAALLGATLTASATLAVVVFREAGAYESLVILAFGGVCALIVATDIRTLRAPNAIVYPATLLAFLAALPLGIADASQALAGGVVAFAILLLVAIIGRGAMGLGDVKVGALAGIVVGLNSILLMLVAAFITGGVFAALVLLLRLRGRKDVVAFTPFLILGAILALLLGNGYLVR